VTTVSVRHIVDDIDAAIAFYTQRLGFSVDNVQGESKES
jgi:catechol 2,3-dioxygenase-like lactoylglutathione lyase family enzyme